MASFNRVCLIAFVASIALLGATDSRAYEFYSTDVSDQGGCATCHGAFRSGVYQSIAEGESWGDHLHNIHLGNLSITGAPNGSCDNCHGGDGSGNSRTVNLSSSGNAKDGVNAVSCMGCHGRFEDTNSLGPLGIGWGAGLRQHHENSVGASGQCVGCHQDSSPANYITAGEDAIPPWYANVTNTIASATMSPCNLAGEEDMSQDQAGLGLDNDGDHAYDAADSDCAPAGPLADLAVAADQNDNGNQDIGVLRRGLTFDRNFVFVVDGGTDAKLTKVAFGTEVAKAYTSVPDVTGDGIPEHAVLVEGSLMARVKNPVDGSLLSKPSFNPAYEPIALLAVGDVDGDAGQDLAVVGREAATGLVQAQIKRISNESLVTRFNFDKNFVPVGAVVADDAGDLSPLIAVLGVDSLGRVRAQVKEASDGALDNLIYFDKAYKPIAFAALPDPSGNLTYLAVLGRNSSNVIRAQIKKISDGSLVSLVSFDNNYEPAALLGFTDSDADNSGEVAVIGVDRTGKVRSQTKEIETAALVSVINFDPNYSPVSAIAISNVAGNGRSEIAVLGFNGENHRLQIKDLLTGSPVNNIAVP